jgi:hypothetical protein
MTESTTIQISRDTKADLDKIKNPKEPYDRTLKRVLKKGTDNADSRYITLKMTPEEYHTLQLRQTWPICYQILRDSKQ